MNSSDPLLGNVTSTVQKVEVNVCGVRVSARTFTLYFQFFRYTKKKEDSQSQEYTHHLVYDI